MPRPSKLLALLLLAAGCGTPPSDGPPGSDAGGAADADASVDAGPSVAFDAGAAVTGDAGTADAGSGDAGLAQGDAGAPVIDGGSADAGAILSGVLVGGTGRAPGVIPGVRYEGSGLSGMTDQSGTFQYRAGGAVTFFVSDVTLGTVAGAPQVSPWQLTGLGCASGPALDKVLVFLFSLDDDANPANGTVLPVLPAVSPRRAITAMTMAEVVTRIGELIAGRAALSVAQATDLFIRQVDDETWAELSHDTFNGTTALSRGQGVTNDGTYWYFSGWALAWWHLAGIGCVEKTDAQFNTISKSSIPQAQYNADKSNHIGDIDLYNGNLYLPLEDGDNGYLNPRVMLVDTANLNFGAKYTIPHSLQTQGVPWVAVDAARSFVYLAEWSPTTQLNRFNLATMAYVDSLPLTMPAGQTLSRIQGAKVFEGALYLSTDDAGKTIYKLNLETGTVLKLFGLIGIGEEQGLTFWARPDGSLMHTLNVGTSSTSSELHHHARTRLPLRRQLCP